MITTNDSLSTNQNQEPTNEVNSDSKTEQVIEEIASDLDFIQMATIIQEVSKEKH